MCVRSFPSDTCVQVPYVDVCDDARLATVAKALNDKAQEAGVSATISAGIWPGIDQLMAVEVRATEQVAALLPYERMNG